jgi:hypothetical protein
MSKNKCASSKGYEYAPLKVENPYTLDYIR